MSRLNALRTFFLTRVSEHLKKKNNHCANKNKKLLK